MDLSYSLDPAIHDIYTGLAGSGKVSDPSGLDSYESEYLFLNLQEERILIDKVHEPSWSIGGEYDSSAPSH